MTNTEAADKLRVWLIDNHIDPTWTIGIAIVKAITALEHQPEPQHDDDQLTEYSGPTVQELYAVQCASCSWRTLDTHRLLCDSCGGHELKPVYEVGK